MKERITEVALNGGLDHHYSRCLNYSFAYVEGKSLLVSLKNVDVNSGYTCTSSSLEPSYVFRALGVGDELVHSILRFGVGRSFTEVEINLCWIFWRST